MLGRFLEFSVAAPDIAASLDFYRRLKFSQAQVGDAWAHPYAVVTDGRICIGLHQIEMVPTLTFVKPELLKFIAAAERTKLTLEYRQLGSHMFNEVGLLDPEGHALRLIEARTFSPSERQPNDFSACGYFEEIALPGTDLEAAKIFWEKSGFVGMDEFDARLPHIACTSDFINIGLYDRNSLRQPALIFAVSQLSASLDAARGAGVAASTHLPPPLSRKNTALLVAPEGTQLYIFED